MVNASLNWASIVGIVLAVGGAGLYFLRSFKPALARDYDVFFAAIGLLCGGILFFQGWRLDPILQFGQFLLAGTTVFFAYESVRLRGLSIDQARRSAYFDDDPPSSADPNGGFRERWDDSYDQFEESAPIRRRFSGSDAQPPEDDFYRPRRVSRAAIPEEAASRRIRSREGEDSWNQENQKSRRMARFSNDDDAREMPSFGSRRNVRQDQRRGSRPSSSPQGSTRRSRSAASDSSLSPKRGNVSPTGRPGIPQGSPMRVKAEDAAFSPSAGRKSANNQRDGIRSRTQTNSRRPPDNRTGDSAQSKRQPRDNSSRFDD